MTSCRVSISDIAGANLIASSSPPMTQSACHLEELIFLCLLPALLGVPLCAPVVQLCCWTLWWCYIGGKIVQCSGKTEFLLYVSTET